jgi:hypothetical protein
MKTGTRLGPYEILELLDAGQSVVIQSQDLRRS